MSGPGERLRWLAILGLLGILPLAYWGSFADCFPLSKWLILMALGITAILTSRDFRLPAFSLWGPAWTVWTLGGALLGRNHPSLWRSLPEAALLILPVWIAASAAGANMPLSRIREAVLVCVGAAALVAAIGLMQLAGLADGGWMSPFSKGIASTIGNPDLLGGFLVFPFAVGLAACLGGKANAFWILGTILMGLALLGTESRAAWLAAGTAAGLLVMARRRTGLMWLAAALLLAAAVLAANPSLRARVLSLSALEERLWTWRHALLAIRGSPLAGWGISSFRTVYLKEQTKTHRGGENYYHYTEYAHLEPLHFWTELGAIGLGLLVWGLVSCARAWRGSRLRRFSRELWLGVGAGGLAFLIDALFSFPLHVAPSAVHFWFFLGACGGGAISPGAVPAVRRGPNPLPWVVGALLMLPALRIAYSNAALREAQVLSRAGDSAGAMKQYLAAIRLVPGEVRLVWNLASLERQSGNYPAAQSMLERALELEPDFFELHHERGMAMKALGKFAAAEHSYRRALEINPEFAHSWNNLGNLLGEQGRLAGAETAQRRALDLSPDSAEARRNLAVTLIRQGREEEAERILAGGKW